MSGTKTLIMGLDLLDLFAYLKQRTYLSKKINHIKKLISNDRFRVDNVWYIMDHGSEYDTGTATHHLTMYKAASGAIVCTFFDYKILEFTC